MPVLREQTTAAVAEPAMRPGEYLRLRRIAAGLTNGHISIALRPAQLRNVADLRSELKRELILLEADQLLGTRSLDLVDILARVYSFDPSVYHLLVARQRDPACREPLPQICRGCGCTENDACVDRLRGPCGWARPELCTHCADRPSLQAGAPTHAA